MSLQRLLLRQFACMALLQQDGDAGPVTMAGDKVFDSRLDTRQFTTSDQQIPCIVVYTDDDKSNLLNRSANSGPRLRHVDLRIEISVSSFDTVQYTQDNKTKSGVAQFLPTTDPELEAKLDMFETQINWALFGYANRYATIAMRNAVVQLEAIDSAPHRDETASQRLAMRRIIYTCRINDDCPPLVVAAGTPMPPSQSLVEDDFPVAPWLKPMLVALQDNPMMKNVVSALGGDVSRAFVAPMLKRIGVDVDFMVPITDPAVLATARSDRAPDGRTDYHAIWELKN